MTSPMPEPSRSEEGRSLVEKIISGAQTGADRAGLDAALALGLEVGGTVPKGRRTEEGPLTDEQMARYCLEESSDVDYRGRTKDNVTASDGTAIFGHVNSPGSQLTVKFCAFYRRPYVLNPNASWLREWTAENEIRTLNIAGNRESGNPGIYERVLRIVMEALGGPDAGA